MWSLLYNYDIKGRLISKTVVLSSDVNGATPYVYGNNATATETQYTYDGMDRMLLKSVGQWDNASACSPDSIS